ncbi:MAG: IS3 family transposase [Gallionella sp.]|jgi:hypothetical protein|nr:IS3 family transposase [Gallionella sp.]
MCRELNVTRQGYYAWRARQLAPPTARQVERQGLVELIAEIFAEHKGRYGAPRIWVELRRRGRLVGMNRVAAIMAELGLVGKSGRRGVPPTTVTDPGGCSGAGAARQGFQP